jgi:NADH:ubiquinone oxidoreductase subunit B-like Fe-S oxidoreductase
LQEKYTLRFLKTGKDDFLTASLRNMITVETSSVLLPARFAIACGYVPGLKE